MCKLEKDIELAKDLFITYCAKRFKNDAAIQDSIKDIQHLEYKKQAAINSKRRKKDKTSLSNLLWNLYGSYR